jgi:arylsulfatase A-like enzyme
MACLDDNIGRLLNAIDRLELTGNTLVIFFSDNGGTQHGGGCNRPLRGTKSTMFEGGIRVPFMMRWPGKLPAGKRYAHRISTLDLLPTCLEAAGIPGGSSAKLDGHSFLQAARRGAPSPTEHRPLFWHYRDRWAVLSGEWKLVRSPDPGGPRAYQIVYDGDSADAMAALFNLTKDPTEQHDVSKVYPEVVERLTRLFEDWRREMQSEAMNQ